MTEVSSRRKAGGVGRAQVPQHPRCQGANMNFILSDIGAGRGLESYVFHWIDPYLNGDGFSGNHLKQCCPVEL